MRYVGKLFGQIGRTRGYFDTGKTSEDWDALEARAERAEAELASERGRLDYLSTRGFEHRHHETGDHLGYEWTISSYSESEDVTLRDVIDAEMREDEKGKTNCTTYATHSRSIACLSKPCANARRSTAPISAGP